MTNPSRGMVIVGAGHTGGRAAHALREAGWSGAITLVGSEPHAPYERPPLSKEFLAGTRAAGDSALYAEDFYAGERIDLRLESTAREIRRDRREVVLADGDVLPYERLLLATGAEPRRLDVPGGDRDGVFYLRDRADSEALAARLGPGKRIAIVGGGFIGLEVAANAIARGCRVTVIEAGPRLLMRTVPEAIEKQVRARHQAAGVELRLGRQTVAIEGDGAVSGVRLDDGETVPCDIVLVSIGVIPRVDLADAAGLAIDNGIAVDPTLRTDDPNIFAAGDVCSFRSDLFDARIRLESWKNAEEQGPLAARNMLGAAEACDTVPWMWSDQYDLTIQLAGLPDRAARTVTRIPAPDAVILFHLAGDGRLIGASGLGPNAVVGRAVRLGQMMIERRLYPDPEALADPAVNLKTLMREKAA